MPGFVEKGIEAAVQASQEYSVLKQRVDLDVNFANQKIRGSAEITVQPLVKELRHIQLHSRQCKLTSVQAGGITATWEHVDPHRRARMPESSNIHQHGMLKSRIAAALQPAPQPELTITLPSKLKIQELRTDPANTMAQDSSLPGLRPEESDIMATAMEAPAVQPLSQQHGPNFAPLKLSIEFEVDRFRDGVHWIGCAEDDGRLPYMYSKASPFPGNTSNIFPCVDDSRSRCSWEVSISCPKTLGDAFRKSKIQQFQEDGDVEMTDAMAETPMLGDLGRRSQDGYTIDLSDQEAALDLAVICVGDVISDAVDSEDDTRHAVTFRLPQPVTARHVGFAIGPFEHVDLSASRGSAEEEKLGQSAVKINGYCLPRKSKDLRNTCVPIAWAIDHMGVKYGSFPFSNYQVLFVDDLAFDTVPTAGLSFCSASLLFPKSVIEPMDRNTRTLVRALADQWIGVNVIAKEAMDEWIIAGIAGFMTDLYMKELAGNNEFRWQQKLAGEKVYELDVDRPSIHQLGEFLHLDHTIRDFVNLKAALVLFILDRRLMKVNGQTGVTRIISKMFLNAKTGALVNGELSTVDFQRTCERLGHNKLESFFRQWVFNSGCPIFYVTQRFNKKKLVVEMTIVQKQLERVTKPAFEPNNFMREIKEHVRYVWAPEANPVFTGPMTIRIHEADGTPYEHIVEIKEATTRLEIPYNTKYKRLKRSRRQKERQLGDNGATEGGDDGALLYCLGDILDTEEERRDWNLQDWTAEEEEKMGQESYEWIRMDADFEWIGKIHLVMPLYMYISQLQQDRDIVAQYESMRYLLGSNPHRVSLSILVRTLMDTRYFWGIREMAAEGLAICARNPELHEIGAFHLSRAFRQLFCISNNMPKPNDFSDRRNFMIQCAIPKAMAKLKDSDGKVPMGVRSFFVDLLKFNDNSNNKWNDGDVEDSDISDNHYIATLMSCLADSLVASHREPEPSYTFNFGDEEPLEPEDNPDAEFERLAIAQIDRYRRIDEWDSSYHNIYSTTALECLQRLTKAKVAKDKSTEVMQYVKSVNADNVRLAAFRCLSEMGVMRKMSALQYLLKSLANDLSPSFREGLLIVLGEALGHIALGDAEPEKTPEEPGADGGLVLEQEASNEARMLEANRKTTPEGALVALKTALIGEETFKQALWYAATSPDITLNETAALCDIAALIYQPVNSLIVEADLPQMWGCAHLGNGVIRFTTHPPYREKPQKGLSLEDWQDLQKHGLKYSGPLSDEIAQKQKADQQASGLKLKIAQAQQQITQAQGGEMPPPSATPTAEGGKPAFKLSLGSKRKQSVDPVPRSASPKPPKIPKMEPATKSAGPSARGSPKAPKARRPSLSSTATAPKPKRKVAKLKFTGRNPEAAQAILAHPSRPNMGASSSANAQSKQRSASIASSSAQSPPAGATNSTNYFSGSPFHASASPAASTMNLGSFRSYGPAPDPDDMPLADVVKREETAEMSPNGVNGSRANGSGSPAEGMPPPPKPRAPLKLKLAGPKKGSTTQSSPQESPK